MVKHFHEHACKNWAAPHRCAGPVISHAVLRVSREEEWHRLQLQAFADELNSVGETEIKCCRGEIAVPSNQHSLIGVVREHDVGAGLS
jgi:hypothetical protein